MITLRTTASMRAALTSSLDPALRALLGKRMAQLARDYDGDLADIVEFSVVEPGDSSATIEAGVGFSILHNLVDGAAFGEPDFTPSWEWAQDHGAFFELVFILSDDGYGIIVFVPDDPGVEFDVHALCLEHVRCPPDRCRFE